MSAQYGSPDEPD